jgi:hypothetical protein
LEGIDSQRAIQIFATDLGDAASLERARVGIYPESIEADVGPERLRRFFIKEERTYRIAKAIREMCVVARQNVTVDRPFSHVDLITCRNVLIYMSPPLQPWQQEATDRDGRWWLLRVQPYRTVDNRIDGATIVAVDIDVIKRSEELAEERDYARAIVQTVREPLVVLDAECGLAWRMRHSTRCFAPHRNRCKDVPSGIALRAYGWIEIYAGDSWQPAVGRNPSPMWKSRSPSVIKGVERWC